MTGARVELTRKYRFSASHRLHAETLSDEENRNIFGKCNNPYGHGHNYEVEVTVSAKVEPASGLAVGLGQLDELVKRDIISRYDHRNMNLDLPEYRELVPTTENVAQMIARQLGAGWPEDLSAKGTRLKRIRVHETRNNIFEVECQ